MHNTNILEISIEEVHCISRQHFTRSLLSAGGASRLWVDLHNPNYGVCSADPSTCTQPFTNKNGAAVVSTAHMDVMDFSKVDGSDACVKFNKNLKVETKDCTEKAFVLCESSCIQTRECVQVLLTGEEQNNDFCFFTPIALSSCPIPGASLTMVNGKFYHGSAVQRKHQNVRNYCVNLDLEVASISTQENYNNVQYFIGRSAKFHSFLHRCK